MDLGDLMPGEWEMACDAHGYSGDFIVEKYGRTYPSASDLEDSAWGLVFISHDGTYTSVGGHCKPTGMRIYLPGCVPRQQAVLHASAQKSGACTDFR
ncbi:MAG: hypothetical protein V4505_13370 [Pseudomonadota bacterium]